jgi:hypothetical protein
MNPPNDSPAESLGIVLPLAVLGLASCLALPSLVAAWSHDVYARGALLACAFWLAPPVWLWIKNRKSPATPCFAWLAVCLLLCTAGVLMDLRVFYHLAFASSIAAMSGSPLAGLVITLAAFTWLPVTGWVLSHWQSGGLDTWQRPALSALITLILLALSLLRPKTTLAPPPHS